MLPTARHTKKYRCKIKIPIKFTYHFFIAHKRGETPYKLQNYVLEENEKNHTLSLRKAHVKFSLNLLTFELMFIIFAKN